MYGNSLYANFISFAILCGETHCGKLRKKLTMRCFVFGSFFFLSLFDDSQLCLSHVFYVNVFAFARTMRHARTMREMQRGEILFTNHVRVSNSTFVTTLLKMPFFVSLFSFCFFFFGDVYVFLFKYLPLFGGQVRTANYPC